MRMRDYLHNLNSMHVLSSIVYHYSHCGLHHTIWYSEATHFALARDHHHHYFLCFSLHIVFLLVRLE